MDLINHILKLENKNKGRKMGLGAPALREIEVKLLREFHSNSQPLPPHRARERENRGRDR